MINLVLSTQRSGSIFLFLHFHDRVQHVCFEPFNSVTERKEYDEIRNSEQFINRIEKPLEYLEFLSSFGIPNIKLEIIPPKILSMLHEDHKKFRIAILFRNNILKQYISFKTANRSSVFYSDEKLTEHQYKVDISEFEKYSNEIRKLYETTRVFIDTKNIEYENLDVKDVAKYFDVLITHTPSTIKLHSDYSFITNRNELNNRYPQWQI